MVRKWLRKDWYTITQDNGRTPKGSHRRYTIYASLCSVSRTLCDFSYIVTWTGKYEACKYVTRHPKILSQFDEKASVIRPLYLVTSYIQETFNHAQYKDFTRVWYDPAVYRRRALHDPWANFVTSIKLVVVQGMTTKALNVWCEKAFTLYVRQECRGKWRAKKFNELQAASNSVIVEFFLLDC